MPIGTIFANAGDRIALWLKRLWLGIRIVLGFIGLYFIVYVGTHLVWTFTPGEMDITVHKVEGTGQASGSMFIVMTDKGMMTNIDSMVWAKRDSRDLQNLLATGGPFTCSTQGFRQKWYDLSINLIDCTPLPKQ